MVRIPPVRGIPRRAAERMRVRVTARFDPIRMTAVAVVAFALSAPSALAQDASRAEVSVLPDLEAAGTSAAGPVSVDDVELRDEELPPGDYVCHLVALAERDVRPTIRILPDGWYAYLPGGEDAGEYEVDPETGRVEWDGVLDHDRVSATVGRANGAPLIRLWVDRGTPGENERVCARPADVGETMP